MNKIFYFILIFILLLLTNDLFGYKENNTNITFIHIPKNAGTSIEYEGYKNGYIWGKYIFYNLNIIYYFDKLMVYTKLNYKISLTLNRLFAITFNYKNKKHHIPYYIKNNINTKKNKISFMVVRNPYSKIISCFKFLKNEKDINVFVKKHIDMYKNKTQFADYVLFIPQYKYLLNNTEILKFENLQEDFYNFCKKHNLKKITLQKVNISQNNKTYIYHLNNESITIINEIYSKDFELFGYKKINPN
jgi:hypothetical protein